MKKILVTGGAGFIGTNLCRILTQDKNNYVICLDNFYSSSPSNIYKLSTLNNFEFVRHDVTFPWHTSVDEIYHLACPASPVFYQKDPVQTIKTAVMGSINALELANRANAKILLTSTSEIYGDPLVHPQPETYWGNVNSTGIRSCYDEGKRCAETSFYDFHRQYNLDIRVVRIFNTYGPFMAENDGRVVSNFITQAINNTDITIHGNGSQTRCFQYIDDLITGLILTMNSTYTQPINIGNTDEFTIKELAEQIIILTGSKSSIVYKTLPLDDPKQRKPDIHRANTILNWQPTVNIENGLLATIKYFKELKNV